MRVRPQSYLLPAALVMCMFFCSAAFSEKKNSVDYEESGRGVKFYNENYKKRAAEGDRDIISFNKKNYNADDNYSYTNYNKIKNTASAKKSANSKARSEKSHEETVFYIVKSGDTLYGIAGRSGMTVEKIQELNNLTGKSTIYKGMKLKVYSGKSGRKNINEIQVKEKNTVAGDFLKKNNNSSKPLFLWPLKKVKGYSRDGKDGVKPIGITIKGNPGGDVVASENGIVKRVGYMRGYGKYIVLTHGKRYITVYSNLMDIDVKTGDSVEKGVKIGNISDDMTLHFQIDRAGKPENPLMFLPGKG